jgi:hypothetical protein
MHSYSTDSPDRQFIPFFLAALAIASGFGISVLCHYANVELPWWTPPLDTMTIYGALYWLFDHHIWKSKLLRTLGVVQIPALNGQWKGRVRPAESEGVSKGLTADTDITIVIQQTWQKISVRGSTELSNFRSDAANVSTDDGGSLGYQYVSEPIASSPATMNIHRGTARFALGSDGMTLHGEYYSGRGRQNIGVIDLKRCS